MTDNSKRIIERMQDSFPNLYNVYDKNTILYTLLSIFGGRLGARTNIIDRLYAMIGIDSTYDEDLEHRWGSLLGMYRQNNESYDNYRGRLLITYSSLSGGTAESIKYAIASTAGITNDDDINKYIHVYDAWEYPYELDEDVLGIEVTDEASLYGSSICTVDVSSIANVNYTDVMSTINQVKASGINMYLLFLYGVINESATLSRSDIIHDTIKSEVHDIAEFYEVVSNTGIMGKAIMGRAILGNMNSPTNHIRIDTFVDKIKYELDECGSITNHINTWSNFGTNSAILNKSLVTNMYIEPDEHTDIIIYH